MHICVCEGIILYTCSSTCHFVKLGCYQSTLFTIP
jgi:hypothetical protein